MSVASVVYEAPMWRLILVIPIRTCAIGIGRQIDFTTARPRDFSDTPYAMLPVIIFSGVEPSVAVALACVPLMRPLFFAMRDNNSGIDERADLERRRIAMSSTRHAATRYTGDPLASQAPDTGMRSSRVLLVRRGSDISVKPYCRAMSQISHRQQDG